MNERRDPWGALLNEPRADILGAAMERVAHTLSDMVGQDITRDAPEIKEIAISQVVARAGAPDAEMVGIYLQMARGLRGCVILILPLDFALNLVDLALELPQGASTGLGDVERSVLAELGNMTLACFLNAVAELTGRSEMLQPSPPAVLVDMLGAILNVFITPAAAVSDDLLIVETMFRDAARTMQFRLWMLPDPVIDWMYACTARTVEAHYYG